MADRATGEKPKIRSGKEEHVELILWGALAVAVLAFMAWRSAPAGFGESALRWLFPDTTDPIGHVLAQPVGWFWFVFVGPPAVAVLIGTATVATEYARARQAIDPDLGEQWSGRTTPRPTAVLLVVFGALIYLVGCAVRLIPQLTAPPLGELWVFTAVVSALLAALWATHTAHKAKIRAKLESRIIYMTSPALGHDRPDPAHLKVIERRRDGSLDTFDLLYAVHPNSLDQRALEEISKAVEAETGQRCSIDAETHKHRRALRVRFLADAKPQPEKLRELAPKIRVWFDAQAKALDFETTENEEGEQELRSFTVGYQYSKPLARPSYRKTLESLVADILGGVWDADWNLGEETVTFLRVPGLPTRALLPTEGFPAIRSQEDVRALYKKLRVPIGVDAYGNIIYWNLGESPHLLITGETGSGKTSMMATITLWFCRHGVRAMIVDPKGIDFPGMRGWPNVSLLTAGLGEVDYAEHTAAVRFLADTMRDRYNRVKLNVDAAANLDPIIVILDEWANLARELSSFFSRHKGPKERGPAPTSGDLEFLLRTARAVRIHIVIGLQRPDAEFISGEAKENTAMRVALGRLKNVQAALMMFNDPVSGTRVDNRVRGRGTVQLPDGETRPIQAFFAPKPVKGGSLPGGLDDDERAQLEELRNVSKLWSQWVVDTPLRDERAEMISTFKEIRDAQFYLASERPDLDPLSDEYEPPLAMVAGATMDADPGGSDIQSGSSRPDWVDLPDDEQLPPADDEIYHDPEPMTADQIEEGDLVDLEGTGEFLFVEAVPERMEEDSGSEVVLLRLADPHRPDYWVYPSELVFVRKTKIAE